MTRIKYRSLRLMPKPIDIPKRVCCLLKPRPFKILFFRWLKRWRMVLEGSWPPPTPFVNPPQQKKFWFPRVPSRVIILADSYSSHHLVERKWTTYCLFAKSKFLFSPFSIYRNTVGVYYSLGVLKKITVPKKITVLKIGIQKTKGGTLGKLKGGPLVKSIFQGSPLWFFGRLFLWRIFFWLFF